MEVTLSDGRKALKPVVYFAEATRMAIDSSGALIVAGGDLNLTASGDITNSGTLSGANTTLASTDQPPSYRVPGSATKLSFSAFHKNLQI